MSGLELTHPPPSSGKASNRESSQRKSFEAVGGVLKAYPGNSLREGRLGGQHKQQQHQQQHFIVSCFTRKRMKISIVLLVLGVFCAVSSSVSSSAPSWLENYYRNSVQQASNRKYPNSYYYNYNRYGGSPPRLGGRGRGPSAYAAMSDIDWSKRSGYYQVSFNTSIC